MTLAEPLSDRDLLELLDAASQRAPGELALAFVADPGCSVAEVDVAMLDLHERRFGRKLEAVTTCDACDEALEFALDLAALRPGSRAGADRRLVAAGCEIEFRLPSAVDLAAAGREPDVTTARALLLDRCVVAAWRDGKPIPAAALPPAAISALADRLAEQDPLGGSRVVIACAACGARGEPTVDLVWFVGRELEAEGDRIAGEVHTLASAYGWTEDEILRLSCARRNRYLELVAA
ncbi:MAG TPA: hypothetical protein VI300_00565 [Solirubrobacter sp.]